MKWFSDCATLEEIKVQYKKLAKQYHPDLGGDTTTMQLINQEYSFACAQAVKGAKLSKEEAESEIKFSAAYQTAN